MNPTTIQYFRHDPRAWLIDEELPRLTPEEFFGFFWILQRVMTLNPPGVFPHDDEKLRGWSKLGPEAWERARKAILSLFKKDVRGMLHHQATKDQATVILQEMHAKGRRARAGADALWGKNKGYKKAQPEPFRSPYPDPGPLVSAASDAQASLEQCSSVPNSSIYTVHSTDDRGGTPAALGGAAGPGAPPSPPPPPARMNAADFAAAKESAIAGLTRLQTGTAAEETTPSPKA